MNLNEIERLAREATPGPWRSYGIHDRFVELPMGYDCQFINPKDADYIASVSPDVILSIIKYIRELEAKVNEKI